MKNKDNYVIIHFYANDTCQYRNYVSSADVQGYNFKYPNSNFWKYNGPIQRNLALKDAEIYKILLG